MRLTLAHKFEGWLRSCWPVMSPWKSNVDRIYLNVYVPSLQREQDVAAFFLKLSTYFPYNAEL